MLNFIVRRLMAAMVALFLLSIATFTLLRVMPGDDVICPGFCSRAELEARRHEYGFDKPLFPISFTGDAIWLLVLPAVVAGGYAWRAGRRLRRSAIADYVLPRLAWHLVLGALLAVLLSMTPGLWPEPLHFQANEAAGASQSAEISWLSLLAIPLVALIAFTVNALLTRPRVMNIPRAD